MSDLYMSALTQLSRAYGPQPISALIRQEPEDFYVEEQLSFEPEGQGEHVFLWVEKTNSNTQFVAERLASFAQVSPKHVSFSGLKDRHAVTRQWFSVHLPGKTELDWSVLNDQELTVLAVKRHLRKLKRGIHRSNLFRLRLREVDGDLDQLKARVAQIAQQGVPNYFGEQRFGRNGANLASALRWFDGAFKPRRNQQGYYLSAARSFLFNQVLSARLNQNSWLKCLAGELVMLNGTQSVFVSDQKAQQGDLDARMAVGDIHSTGPMYGKPGSLMPDQDAAGIEQSVLEPFYLLREGLLSAGLKAERRALRVIPDRLSLKVLDHSNVELTFELPSGCFATAVIAELAEYRSADNASTIKQQPHRLGVK